MTKIVSVIHNWWFSQWISTAEWCYKQIPLSFCPFLPPLYLPLCHPTKKHHEYLRCPKSVSQQKFPSFISFAHSQPIAAPPQNGGWAAPTHYKRMKCLLCTLLAVTSFISGAGYRKGMGFHAWNLLFGPREPTLLLPHPHPPMLQP